MMDIIEDENAVPPKFDLKKIKNLGGRIDIAPISSQALSFIGDSEQQSHAQSALERNQETLLIVKIKSDVTGNYVDRTIKDIYALRGKNRPNDEKIDDIKKCGFVLVHEPQAIKLLNQFCKQSFIKTDTSINR